MIQLRLIFNQSKIYKSIKYTSVRYQSHDIQQKSSEKSEMDQVSKDFPISKSKISTKYHKKLPAVQPILKSIFVGKLSKEMVPYPETISRENMTTLIKETGKIKEYFHQIFDTEKQNSSTDNNNDIRQNLKTLGLYGLNISENYGGKGYNFSESLLASEHESISSDAATILMSHRVVADIIQLHGTEEQKERYLSLLADGSSVATEAIHESVSSETSFFNTKAMYDVTTKNWIINGEKSFVINGKDANLLLVLAHTNKINVPGIEGAGITVFLVDSNLPGIKKTDLKTLGCHGCGLNKIQFHDVIVPESSVLGQVHDGNDIAQELLKYQRLRVSLICLGLIKSLINILAEHCINQKQMNISLKDLEFTAGRLSNLSCNAYALESMIYYTAGLIDEFDGQDVHMEVAATKLFAQESLWEALKIPMTFMGPEFLESNQTTETIFRNSAQLYTHSESTESLCLYLGLLGLQHVGMNRHDEIKKVRNPLLHPGYILRKLLKQDDLDNPKLNLQLAEFVHPSLQGPAQCLEISIGRLQLCADNLLTRYGTEVIEKHMEVERIAEMAYLIYTMFTTLSRTSRSYCIGLQHLNNELVLASITCSQITEKVHSIAKQIHYGPFLSNDINRNKVVKQIYKTRGYFPSHPLTYNF